LISCLWLQSCIILILCLNIVLIFIHIILVYFNFYKDIRKYYIYIYIHEIFYMKLKFEDIFEFVGDLKIT